MVSTLNNVRDEEIKKLLENRVIAVVGLSDNPTRPSYTVAEYLQSVGYRIIPVNPKVESVLGETAYPSLLEVPEEFQRQIDVVDVFRRPEHVMPVVEDALELKKRFGHLKAVWMQLGIVNEEAAEAARAGGLSVVMNRCLKIEHSRLM
jgi:hypothetical protein